MIQNELLNQTASKIAEIIDVIFLNRDTKIKKFDKIVTDSIITVSFDIPREIDELRHISIEDSSDKVLSSSDVYVRTVDNTRFSYRLEVTT